MLQLEPVTVYPEDDDSLPRAVALAHRVIVKQIRSLHPRKLVGDESIGFKVIGVTEFGEEVNAECIILWRDV